MHRPATHPRRAVLPAAAFLSVASLAWACDRSSPDPQASVAPAPAVPAPAAPADAGMRAYLDPESGTIVGMPPAGAVAPAAELVPGGIAVETVLPDGSVMLELNGSADQYYVLQLDAEGNRVVRCVQDPDTLPPVAPATPAPAER